MLNSVTQRYVDECRADGSALRDVVRRAPYPARFSEAYGGRMVDRPWFADEARLQRFADDLDAFLTLLLSLPRRLFDGDLRRYCAALGLDERRANLMSRHASDLPARYARPDAYDDGTSFKLLEFNICSALGGLDHAVINQSLLEVDEFRLMVYPIVLGNGKRLFKDGTTTTLKPTATHAFSSGVVALTYQPAGKEAQK